MPLTDVGRLREVSRDPAAKVRLRRMMKLGHKNSRWRRMAARNSAFGDRADAASRSLALRRSNRERWPRKAWITFAVLMVLSAAFVLEPFCHTYYYNWFRGSLVRRLQLVFIVLTSAAAVAIFTSVVCHSPLRSLFVGRRRSRRRYWFARARSEFDEYDAATESDEPDPPRSVCGWAWQEVASGRRRTFCAACQHAWFGTIPGYREEWLDDIGTGQDG